MAHAYVSFRVRLARHALRQFAASLRSSAEILLLAGTHVVVGLLALSAFPAMYAASLPAMQAVPWLAAHALLMAIPLALLRKRVLPIDVVQWAWRLPLPARVRLQADAAVAALLAVPLALLYAVSCAVLLWQGPAWLDPRRGVIGTVCSLLLTFAISIGVLALRSRLPPPRGAWHGANVLETPGYTARRLRPRLPQLWQRLFWLPYWRAESLVGIRQSALLAAALASALPWMQAPTPLLRGALALATSALLIVLTDRGDKAVREQCALLAPVLAPLPLQAARLFLIARLFPLLPALLVVLAVAAGGAPHGLWAHTAGRVWLALACLAPLVLIATPVHNQRARVGLVVVQILSLTAVGSELWP